MSKVYHNGFYAMGTRLYVIFPELDDDTADLIFYKVQDEVRRLEAKLSWFQTNSEISNINKFASKKPVTVSSEVYEALKLCHKYSELTAGAFNITLRPLLQNWRENSENKLSQKNLDLLLEKLKMQYIYLNDAEKTVYFENDELEIDLGGFGKGYALKKINDILDSAVITNAFISFGESSVLTKGTQPGGGHWKIGVKDYFNPQSALHTFNMNEGSVSTSSNFFINDDGKLQNHRHVINPFTGHPVEDIITISVCADNPVIAEILSTAFLVLPEDEIHNIKQNMKDLTAVKINYTSGQPEAAVL